MSHNARLYMSNDARNGRPAQSSVDERGSTPSQGRLEEKTLLLEEEKRAPSEDLQPTVEALRALVEEVDRQGTTYQSVAVAAVQILERALCYEQEAAEAALSLGQQEKLESMVETAEQAVSVLRGTLNAQGHKVMHLCAEQSPSNPSQETSGQPWWFVLTDALEVLEEGTDQMSSLTTGQPADSPARKLSQLIAQILRAHHDALLIEAEEWIS